MLLLFRRSQVVHYTSERKREEKDSNTGESFRVQVIHCMQTPESPRIQSWVDATLTSI